MKDLSRAEKLVLTFVAIVIGTGIFLYRIDIDFYDRHFANEDGFVEWATVLALLVGMVVCFRRVWVLRGQRPVLFLLMTSLLGLFLLFGAGEELSWGQRLFGLESGDFFREHNSQGETNLHNLVIDGIRINKLVFGRVLQILLVVYLAVVIPLYRRKMAVRRSMDGLAIPIATNYQIAAIILVLLLLQVLVVGPRKSELLEFAGSFIFLLTIAFPGNRSLFQASGTVLESEQQPGDA